MTDTEILQILVFALTILLAIPILGEYMARVYEDRALCRLGRVQQWEGWFYSFLGTSADREMGAREYLTALLAFNLLGAILLFFILRLQYFLPFNPERMTGVPFWLAVNTTVSFVTNTNWQAYSGETTLSYFSQLAGLCVQNFLSAGTGMAVMVAFARGWKRQQTESVGNFWVDLTRSVVLILLPLSFLLAVLLVGQGVVQTFQGYVHVSTLEGSQQILPMGPAASQIAIKQLGSNGGGFFGANSAHPFENPTPFSNFLQMFSILLIPAALPYTFGRLIGSRRQGLSILAAMALILIMGMGIGLWAEHQGNPTLGGLPFWEGKEARFGISGSVLWGVVTTAVSNGSVNAMHSSFSPIMGLVTTTNMILGEVVFGGVGAGLYGMLMFVVLTVFIAGLMVGRTPEYLGKKIETGEIKLAVIAVLVPSAFILVGAMIACMTEAGLSGLSAPGPHGLMEIIYAFSSAGQNNGSAFAGLNSTTPFYHILLSLGMILGRYAVIIPVLLMTGSLARKKITPPSSGTFPTDSGLFVLLLVGFVWIVGGLTFFPMLSLGSIAEHLLMSRGSLF